MARLARRGGCVDLDETHTAWLAGWDAGYAQGRQAACEDIARSWLHDMARKSTEAAVRTATARHGTAWGQAIREQAEGGDGP